MKKVLFIFLTLLSIVSFGQTFKKKYNGSIGPYPVTITITCTDGVVTGTYYYESFDDPISIRGFISGKDIEFKGYDLKGNKLDQFIGQMSSHDIQGLWIGEDMQKRYQFKLREDLNGPVTIQKNNRPLYIWSVTIAIVLIFAIFIFIRFRKKANSVPAIIKNIDTVLWKKKILHKMGYEFEKYMTDRLDPDQYKLIEWHTEKHKYPSKSDSSNYPDLVFERKDLNKTFSIECRFSDKVLNDKISLGKRWEFFSKNNFSKPGSQPLFVALGLGGMPSNPERVFIIPAEKIKNDVINLGDITNFRISRTMLDYDPERQSLD